MSEVNNYDAENIDVVEGLDHVKQRPGMYTDPATPNHIGHEVIDNASDEILGGHATKCYITAHADGSLSVEDDGRGIPVGINSKLKKSGVEIVFTYMNSGSKFKKGADAAYGFSGGLHGVGVTVTNALSSKIDVHVKRDGKVHHIGFTDSKVSEKLSVVGKCDPSDTGTTVRFWPDPFYFDSPTFNIDKLKNLCAAKSVLLKGSIFKFTVESKVEGTPDDVTEWHYENGMPDYMAGKLEDTIHSPLYYDSHYWEGDEHATYNNGEGAEWVLSFLTQGKHIRESYVNLVVTRQGGSHISGFERGVFEAVKAFCNANALLPKGVDLRREDVVSRLSYLVSANALDPQFKGQTKEELLSRHMTPLMELCVKAKFENWLSKNYESGIEIANLAIDAAQTRLKSVRKDVIRKTGGVTSPLPDKLSDCTSKVREDIEVFIVEGDSAGGSAKMGRCKKTQAIMPLKGKPLNAWDMTSESALTNQELADLSVMLGVKPHKLSDDPDEVLKKLRYQRAITLADADVDGFHIATLVTANIVMHFPHLITRGHYCIVLPPLFKIEAAKQLKLKAQKHYVQDEQERDKLVAKLEKQGYKDEKISVSRFKGLGEMNPIQLKETSLDPDTRVLITPSVDSDGVLFLRAEMNFLFSSKCSQERNDWVSADGDFEKYLN